MIVLGSSAFEKGSGHEGGVLMNEIVDGRKVTSAMSDSLRPTDRAPPASFGAKRAGWWPDLDPARGASRGLSRARSP